MYGGGLWIALQIPRPNAARAAAESEQPAVLTPAEWATIEAITGRIIPTDAEPGAIEARCVNFIDKALANEDAQARPLYALGVVGADAAAQRRFGRPFVKLAPAEQDELLVLLEEGRAPGWPDGPVASPAFFATRARPHDHRLPRGSEVRRQPRFRRLEAGRLSRAAPSRGRLHPGSDAGPGEDQERVGRRAVAVLAGSCIRFTSEGASSFST